MITIYCYQNQYSKLKNDHMIHNKPLRYIFKSCWIEMTAVTDSKHNGSNIAS